MDKNWTLIYHEDNRCSGSTDGEKKNLLNTQIDIKITLNVKNNSEYAWACEKKASYNYDFDFDLKKQIKNWDRFELQSDGTQIALINKMMFFIFLEQVNLTT